MKFLLFFLTLAFNIFAQSVFAQADPYANGVGNYLTNQPVGTTENVDFGIGNGPSAATAIAPNSVEWTFNFPINILTVGIGIMPAGFYEYSRTVGTSLVVIVRNSATIPRPTLYGPSPDFTITYPVTGTVAGIQGTITSNVATLPGFGAQGNNDAINDNASSPIIFIPKSNLPINLLEFTGNLNNNLTTLNWKVENEENFLNYEVMRSINGIDFFSIGKVNGENKNKYSFLDNINAQFATTFYYKLKLNNKDGSFKYSNIVVLRNLKLAINQIYPSPFDNYLNIELQSSKNDIAKIKLVDLNGKIIKSKTTSIFIGLNNVTFNDLQKLNAGIFFIEVITSDNKIVKKVVKQ